MLQRSNPRLLEICRENSSVVMPNITVHENVVFMPDSYTVNTRGHLTIAQCFLCVHGIATLQIKWNNPKWFVYLWVTIIVSVTLFNLWSLKASESQ